MDKSRHFYDFHNVFKREREREREREHGNTTPRKIIKTVKNYVDKCQVGRQEEKEEEEKEEEEEVEAEEEEENKKKKHGLFILVSNYGKEKY